MKKPSRMTNNKTKNGQKDQSFDIYIILSCVYFKYESNESLETGSETQYNRKQAKNMYFFDLSAIFARRW